MALKDESGFLSLLAEAKQKLVEARAMAQEEGERTLDERVEDAIKAIQMAEQWITRSAFFEHPEQGDQGISDGTE